MAFKAVDLKEFGQVRFELLFEDQKTNADESHEVVRAH